MKEHLGFTAQICRPLFILLANYLTLSFADDYTVRITGDTNVVIGGTLRIKAELFDDFLPARGQFRYSWRDNAIPAHEYVEESKLPVSFWNITYSPKLYAPGPYNIEVDVEGIAWWGGYKDLTSQRYAVNVTLYLTGELQAAQGGSIRDSAVAINQPVVHTVDLTNSDELFIRHHKNKVISYWFVDCSYVGPTEGLSSAWNYSQSDSTHDVMTIVVASYAPPPPPPTTTTSTTTTSPPTTPPSNQTTTTSKTTTTTTSTTPKPTTTAPATTKSPVNASINSTTTAPAPLDRWAEFLAAFPKYNASQRLLNATGTCFNMSSIPMSDNSTYGLFQKKLIAKAPVRVKVNGTNWLRDGDIFSMNVTCNGSTPLSYCIKLYRKQYNVTGNESCENWMPLPSLNLHFSHLFKERDEYTYLVIVQNPVSKAVTPVGVNIYEVKKQPQISVIVVPVAFSIVAVVLIVSGVAWYVHTRRTLPIEVADFDFGQQSADMEYKTFRERLRDSVMASFFRAGDSHEPKDGWSPTRHYGSMH